jgi:hypothetical protein
VIGWNSSSERMRAEGEVSRVPGPGVFPLCGFPRRLGEQYVHGDMTTRSHEPEPKDWDNVVPIC